MRRFILRNHYYREAVEEPEFRPYKIFSFAPTMSGNRDCISLFFEYAGSGIIKINKFYYESRTFVDFLKDYSIEAKEVFNYPNIRVSSYDVRWREFVESINYLSNAISRYYPEKSDFLTNSVRELLDRNGDLSDESIEAVLDNVNETLTGYQFYFRGNEQRHFFNDELIDAINVNIEAVPYTDDLENVRVPACMPEEYRVIDNPDLFELRVYSVGQANCSALIKYTDLQKSDFNVVVVFDFGLESGKRNAQLNRMINKIDENTTIIISHFDMDHINNIGKFLLKRTCRWLFPEHEPRKKKANLLYHDLLKTAARKSVNGRQVFSYKTPYSLSTYLRINQNTNNRIADNRYQSTLANAQCIISSLCINDTNVLIPADALYRDFPADVFNYRYNYVLIPHHGCEYGDPVTSHDAYFDSIKEIVNDDLEGIVMCGKGGIRYGHANTKHLQWYNRVTAFDSAFFFSSRGTIDATYAPTNIVSLSYYPISFKH